jgi:hypothetical protein
VIGGTLTKSKRLKLPLGEKSTQDLPKKLPKPGVHPGEIGAKSGQKPSLEK